METSTLKNVTQVPDALTVWASESSQVQDSVSGFGTSAAVSSPAGGAGSCHWKPPEWQVVGIESYSCSGSLWGKAIENASRKGTFIALTWDW